MTARTTTGPAATMPRGRLLIRTKDEEDEMKVAKQWQKSALATIRTQFQEHGLPLVIAEALRTAAASELVSLPYPNSGTDEARDGVKAAVEAIVPFVTEHPHIDFQVWSSCLAAAINAVQADAPVPTSVWAEQSLQAAREALAAPIPYVGLLRARDYLGADWVLELLASGAKIVRMSPKEARNAMYVSQVFFDQEKFSAVRGIGIGETLPARVEIRTGDNFLHFVLADGHHRALRQYYLDEPILLQVDPALDVKVAASFRNYLRQHPEKML